MSREILLAVASGSDDLIPTLVEKLRAIRPDLPLYIVSEFQHAGGTWLPYRPGRTLDENLAAVRSLLRDKSIVYTALILQPRMPYWTMRRLAWRLGGWNTIFFNENLDHFMLRPRSAGTIARHLWWRTKNFLRWELRPGGTTYTLFWRLRHPRAFERPWIARRLRGLEAALVAAKQARREDAPQDGMREPSRDARGDGSRDARRDAWRDDTRESSRDARRDAWRDAAMDFAPGVSVVIPSRNGRDLLARLLPGLLADMAAGPGEVIVVDNGSDDGTAAWLAAEFPGVRVETSAAPLSFARAANRGIFAARHAHVLLLNNDMVIEPGFFTALREPFRTVPDLFCATAQIFFPEGVRRQETGKAVMPPHPAPDRFPVTCLEPIEGEDHTWVLYGSGGCSLYDAAKLRALGGLLEIYEPAYVEDLDLGWRAWHRGWPTVFVAGARVEHRHRATTSRYYSQAELDRVLEVNYLKFLAASVDAARFPALWRHAVARLNARAARTEGDAAAMEALRIAAREAATWVGPLPRLAHPDIAAIGSGEIAVFPGRARGGGGRPVVLIASPYIPFPLSHGGAVRMYNLMRRAARDFDLVLLCFVEQIHAVPPEVLDICAEVVAVRREGRHDQPLTGRPDVVEEFDRPAFHAALYETLRKWRPALVQLEYTQMALYAPECRPARTILVEHDITFDLYGQLLEQQEDWETRQQYTRWLRFEKEQAWRDADAIVVMSEKDRKAVSLPRAVTLANGVDLERFQPAAEEPEPRRILFIGAFSHLPNVLAIDFFLREAWPRIRAAAPAVLHIIAGRDHRAQLARYQDRVQPVFEQPGVEVEDFVSDPRIAYRRAAVVIAPLLASAGTNIKIMEAMAMGRAIVTTPGGINGLDELRDGHDVVVRLTGAAMAEAILALFDDAALRRRIEAAARASAERYYGWDAIASRQRDLYAKLMSCES